MFIQLKGGNTATARQSTGGRAWAANLLEKRIAVVRQNIAGLVEQAAAFSGAGDEARTADRIAEQEQELARLIALQEARLVK